MLRALSLFSGIGGLCEGVKLAGFNVVGAAELDKYSCESYKANFPEIPLYEGDVKDFLVEGSESFRDQYEKYVGGDVDLVFGGPPCQGFSQIGPRDEFDPRNELYLQVCRIAETLNPKVILIENVPNMILMKKGLFKDRVMEALSRSGYSNVSLLKLCADQYGIPQSRNRVFFVAVRDGLISQSAQGVFENVASSMVKPMVSVDEAIGDLPEGVAPDSGIEISYPLPGKNISNFIKEMRLDKSGEKYSESSKKSIHLYHAKDVSLQNHHTKDVKEKRKKIIGLLEPGKKADSLPKELWDNKRPEKWRRFDGAKPAHTLLAHMHRDLSEWIHPHYNRWITVREAMRLQGFHDGFVLKTSEWQQLKQVGNAVPPFLGEVPARAAKIIIDISNSNLSEVELDGQLSLI